jgi:hypothetical protein
MTLSVGTMTMRAAVFLAAAGVTVGVAAVGPTASATEAASAPRITGTVSVGGVSAQNTLPLKTMTAVCPAGKQVVGGGARSEYRGSAVLTRLEPHWTGSRYAFTASAAVPRGAGAPKWSLRVFAMCVDPVPGYQIIVRPFDSNTPYTKAASARCPSGQRALGAGARIGYTDGYQNDRGVSLQVARASGTGDIARAQARAQASYPYAWGLTAIAVCAQTPQYYEVVSSNTAPDGIASVECPKAWDYSIPGAAEVPQADARHGRCRRRPAGISQPLRHCRQPSLRGSHLRADVEPVRQQRRLRDGPSDLHQVTSTRGAGRRRLAGACTD